MTAALLMTALVAQGDGRLAKVEQSVARIDERTSRTMVDVQMIAQKLDSFKEQMATNSEVTALKERVRTLEAFRWMVLAAGGLVNLLMGGIGWFFLRRAFAPHMRRESRE